MENKWVLITGASRGIGKGIAQYLANKGYNLVLHCSKDTSRLDTLRKELENNGIKTRAIAFDTRNREECAQVLSDDIQENGIYYSIVLNAGIAKDNPFPAMEDSDWDDVLTTNLDGFYNVHT